MSRTIAETATLIASKQLSPVELTREHLARIASLNPALHAFIRVTEERAMADARVAEARQMAGRRSGSDGIDPGGAPITLRQLRIPSGSQFENLRGCVAELQEYLPHPSGHSRISELVDMCQQAMMK